MNKILEYRKQHNLTQDDLAFDLGRAGLQCTKSNISRWERGLCMPNSDTREIIADVLKITEYTLFRNLLENLDYKNYGKKAVKNERSQNTG